jgi:hypothetical protein
MRHQGQLPQQPVLRHYYHHDEHIDIDLDIDLDFDEHIDEHIDEHDLDFDDDYLVSTWYRHAQQRHLRKDLQR